jgi:hypothetical protein
VSTTDVKSIPDALGDLRNAADRRRTAQAEWEAAQAAFLDAARAARIAGAKVTSIGTAAGISRQRAHSIVQGVKPVDAA